MSILRFALVGTSSFANSYVRAIKRIRGAKIDLVHSRDQERAQIFCEQHGLKRATKNLHDLCESSIDAAIIAMEPSRHIDFATPLLEAGKDLIIEKPLDLDLKKAVHFTDKVERSTSTVTVSAPLRFDLGVERFYRALKEITAGGEPVQADLRISMFRPDSYYENRQWRMKDSAVFLNQGIHWLDLCNWFFGEPKLLSTQSKKTRPFLECPDESFGEIEYPNKVHLRAFATTNQKNSEEIQFRVQVGGKILDYVSFVRWYDLLSPAMGSLARITGRPLPGSFPLARQIQDFIDAVQSRRKPRVSVRESLVAMQLAIGMSVL